MIIKTTSKEKSQRDRGRRMNQKFRKTLFWMPEEADNVEIQVHYCNNSKYQWSAEYKLPPGHGGKRKGG